MQQEDLENSESIKKVGRKPKATLTIAVDCGSLSFNTRGERGGVATITQQLLTELAQIDKRNYYTLYSFSPISKTLVSRFGGRATNKVLPTFCFKTIWMPLASRIHVPDVFLATSQSQMRSGVHTLAFVYDLAFLEYPTMYKSATKLSNQTTKLINEAKHIITISETSKEDILKSHKVNYRKVSVLYPGVSDIFVPKGPKYVDITPYFLYVGVIKRTKNIEVLLAGFAAFLKSVSTNYKLVLVGKNEMPAQLNRTIRELKLKNDVNIKGYVSTADLPKYYRGAVAFVSPALYEGFGLPLVEAMASGTPVIAAHNSAMKEVVGKAGILVNEKKTDEIAQALETLATNKSIALKYQKLGIKQAKLFSTKRFARGVLDAVYKYCV